MGPTGLHIHWETDTANLPTEGMVDKLHLLAQPNYFIAYKLRIWIAYPSGYRYCK
jgi:hypothetical protein